MLPDTNKQFLPVVVHGLCCPYCSNSFYYDLANDVMTCHGGESCPLSGKVFVIPKLALVEAPSAKSVMLAKEQAERLAT